MNMTQDAISPNELMQKHQNGERICLIDVRTPAEFQEVHVNFAKNYPLDRLDPKAVDESLEREPGEPIYVICKSGTRGKMACDKFQQAGLDCAINVEGGTMACVDNGLPVVRGKKVMSLERQVRIVAGSLAFIGAALVPVSPYFAILSGFIGAGLVFAGITDTCGMGMMLARMPWNQVKSDCPV